MLSSTLLCLLFVILLSFIVAEIELEGDVLVLTDENFNEALSLYDSILIEFYAPWCGHCKSLAPEWTKAATQLKEANIATKLAKVDATEHKINADKLGIQGFPTLKYFKSGKFSSDYNAGRTASEIVTWAIKKSGPPYTTLSTESEFDSFKSKNSVFAIGLFKSLESEVALTFIATAQEDERTIFAISSSEELFTKLGVTVDTLIIFKDFDEERVDLPIAADATVDSLKEFITGNTVPLIQEFSTESSKEIFGSPIKVHALFFTNKHKKHHTPTYAAMSPVASAYRGRLLVVNVPSTESKVLEYFGITEADLPKFLIADMGSESGISKYFYKGEFVAEDLMKFSEDYFTGALAPTLKSEEVDPSDTAGPVTIAKGTSFSDLIINNSKDALVEFYAPWCGHCKKLAPIWDELGERYASNDNIVIAKMDSTANEVSVPGLAVKGFPTIYFFPGDDKANPIKYEGNRELDDFVAFLNEKSKHATSAKEEL